MPGAGKQPPEIQDQIKELLEAGFDPTTIHRRLKVGRSSIYRMKRCLEQHGTNYMPKEMNKKNGRPKVLTPEQELEVSAWLRDRKNRTRYLDDLVWLIHDRFGIVCSTTTMSKMKRKWLRVIDYEENGTPIDETTRAQLEETHPDLPLLHQPQAHHSAPVAEMGDVGSMVGGLDSDGTGMGMQQPLPHLDQQLEHQHQQHQHHPQLDQALQQHQHLDQSHQQHQPLDHQLHQHQQQLQSPQHQQLEQSMNMFQQPTHDPQIDAQLEQQMRHSAEMGVLVGHHGQHLGA